MVDLDGQTEALAEAVESPAKPFFEFEVRPLVDHTKSIDKLIEGMKKQGL